MDQKDFENKVTPLGRRMYGLALHLTGVPAQAQDIVQDVFERLWRKRDELARYDNLEAFALRAVSNACKDDLRHRQVVRRQQQQALMEPLLQSHNPAGEQGEAQRLVEAQIAALPRKQKEAIWLRDIRGYTYEEAAQIMECDVTALRMTLSRARKTVAQRIQAIYDYEKH